MIYKCADLDSINQLRHAAHVVAMKVGDQNIIQLLDAGLMRRGHDAVGVAAFIAGPAGVDEVNLQRFGGGGGGKWAGQNREDTSAENGNENGTHGLAPVGEVAEDYD